MRIGAPCMSPRRRSVVVRSLQDHVAAASGCAVVSVAVARHPCLGPQHVHELVPGRHRCTRHHVACAYAWLQASMRAAEPCPAGLDVGASVPRLELCVRGSREDVDLPVRSWVRYWRLCCRMLLHRSQWVSDSGLWVSGNERCLVGSVRLVVCDR